MIVRDDAWCGAQIDVAPANNSLYVLEWSMV